MKLYLCKPEEFSYNDNCECVVIANNEEEVKGSVIAQPYQPLPYKNEKTNPKTTTKKKTTTKNTTKKKVKRIILQ